ncbi:hypothetical protein ACTA71_005782 [Dictyostelium dimigraforme]
MFLVGNHKLIPTIINNNCLKNGYFKESVITSLKFYSTSKREEGSVEREWWKPTDSLSEALEKSKAQKKPLFVFLEGPSGSGKQQLLERLSNIGYKTIQNSFFKHSLSSTSSTSSTFDNTLNQSINSIKNNSNNNNNNNNNNSNNNNEEIKNNIIFIHRSPISSIIYNNNNNNNNEKLIKEIKEIKEVNNENYNSIYIYCKTPIELIEQRLGGRYHFYEDNETELLEKLKIKSHQEPSYEIYNLLEKESIFNQTLDTTSIKQACPSLLANFNIYFNVQFPPKK